MPRPFLVHPYELMLLTSFPVLRPSTVHEYACMLPYPSMLLLVVYYITLRQHIVSITLTCSRDVDHIEGADQITQRVLLYSTLLTHKMTSGIKVCTDTTLSKMIVMYCKPM